MARGHWRPGKGSYPTNYLIGIVDDATAARHAAHALERHGFTANEVLTFAGPEDYRGIMARETGTWRNWLGLLWWGLSTDEGTSRRRFWEALRVGKANVLVHCPDGQRLRTAVGVLRAAGGYHLIHYGRDVIRHMPGAEVHSSRADESRQGVAAPRAVARAG